MAGRGLINIKRKPKDIKNFDMVEDSLKKRGESLFRTIPYAFAKELYDGLMSGMGSGEDHRDIKKSLQISEVSVGRRGKQGAFAVHAASSAKRVKKMDAPSTVITVKGKSRRGKVPADIKFLEDSGPWTMDTIPFWPKKSEALVMQRKAEKRQVDAISKQRKLTSNSDVASLRGMGRRVKRKKPGGQGFISRRSKAVPDFAMNMISAEFGESGSKANPVWRRSLSRMGPRSMAKIRRKNPAIGRVFDAKSTSYKDWPSSTKRISSSTASGFSEFQKRLGFGK